MLHTLEGPGGLPLGTEGKMVSLISGGIDSPVSTWMMMRRGSPVDLIFISLANPIDTKHFLNKALILYSNWYSGYNPYIYIVDASRLITDYLFKGKMKYANVSYKRKMYEIAYFLFLIFSIKRSFIFSASIFLSLNLITLTDEKDFIPIILEISEEISSFDITNILPLSLINVPFLPLFLIVLSFLWKKKQVNYTC